MPQTSIIIPTFNEAANVSILTEKIQKVFYDVQYEVWFMDDSTDHTPALLKTLSQKNPAIHFIHRQNKRGLASAVVEGFRQSRGDFLIVMDADLQHPPELLSEIFCELKAGNDIVIPSRFIKGGSDGGLGIFRKLISATARTIGQCTIKKLANISDCTSGYFGLRRGVIQDVALDSCSWKILMEILVKGNYKNIKEIPYHFLARELGASKMSLREQWNYLRHVVQLAKWE